MEKMLNDEFISQLAGEFYFVRHGETDWNKQKILMGQTDIPLNATGISQAKSVAQVLDRYPLDKVYASPLMRAYATAQILTDSRQTLPIELLNGLKERRFPSGMLHDDLEHITSDNLPSSAEKWNEFSNRVLTTLEYILAKDHNHPPLIVAHGGVLVAITLALKVAMPTMDNCRPLRFVLDNSGNWSAELLPDAD